MRTPASLCLHAYSIPALIDLVIQSCGRPELSAMATDLPHRWGDAELNELQCDPLAAAARATADSLSTASAAEGWAFDLVSAHSLELEGEYWIVPGSEQVPRSAPRGGRIVRCPMTGDIVIDASSGGVGQCETISSGWRSNAELLLAEGWALPDLESDWVALDVDLLEAAAGRVLGRPDSPLTPTPPLREGQREVLQGLDRLGYLQPADGLGSSAVLSGGYCEDSLGRRVQALAVGPAELEQFGVSGCVINIGEAVSLSSDHERRVGEVLATACDLLLAEFATSLEQDLWLLQQPAGGGVDPWVAARRQQALHARVSRKHCFD